MRANPYQVSSETEDPDVGWTAAGDVIVPRQKRVTLPRICCTTGQTQYVVTATISRLYFVGGWAIPCVLACILGPLAALQTVFTELRSAAVVSSVVGMGFLLALGRTVKIDCFETIEVGRQRRRKTVKSILAFLAVAAGAAIATVITKRDLGWVALPTMVLLARYSQRPLKVRTLDRKRLLISGFSSEFHTSLQMMQSGETQMRLATSDDLARLQQAIASQADVTQNDPQS